MLILMKNSVHFGPYSVHNRDYRKSKSNIIKIICVSDNALSKIIQKI